MKYFLGLVILCFVKEVLTRQEAGAIKDFAALVAKTLALPDAILEESERYENDVGARRTRIEL